MRALVVAAALMAAAPVRAGTGVEVCYNWGCGVEVKVEFDEADLEPLQQRLMAAADAAAERVAVAQAIGELYRLAGAATPISADKAGNWADQEADGRMDCIDHSTTTTRFLQLLQRRGWLRFHRVVEPVWRAHFIFNQHRSAAIEETGERPAALAALEDRVPQALILTQADSPPITAQAVPEQAGPRYVVDSWFVDHGEAAVVMPLKDWMKGEGPNVR